MTRSLTRLTAAAVIAAFVMPVFLMTGCGASPSYIERQSFYFDTVCAIRIYDMTDFSEERADAAIGEAFRACAGYEEILSRTRRGSDIDLINRAGGEPVLCRDDTVALLTKALAYNRLSGGLFCVTIGAVQSLWDFHQAEDPVIPDASSVAGAAASVDDSAVVIEGNTVTLTDPRARLDLGGIAKGYIADRLCQLLRSEGVTSAIISLGGNVACIGSRHDRRLLSTKETPFSVGIETPFSEAQEIAGTVSGDSLTVVTSGIYERCFEVDGRLYHHILDPATGYPADTDVAGVSVIAGEGHSADCDALSTICLLAGTEKGLALIESLDGYEAVFITTDGEIRLTSGADLEPAA